MDTSGPDVRALRSFVAVGEELHFGRAAERLGTAQPALSQQIQRLEAQLGLRLLERTSRSVRLTPAGEVLLVRTRRTLQALAEDVAEARGVAAGQTGSLRIGLVSSAVLTSLPEAVRRYRRTHPRVQVHLDELHTAEVADAVAAGRLDVGIVRDPDAHPLLSAQVLAAEPYVALLPRDHPAATAPDVPVAQLAGEPFVLHPRSAGPRAHDRTMALCEQHGFRPEVTQEASHWLTVAALVGAGLGVSIAPQCVRRVAGPDTACLPLRGSDATSELSLLTPSGEVGPLAADFVAEARAAASASTLTTGLRGRARARGSR